MNFDKIDWDELIALYKYWSLHSVPSQRIVTLLALLSLEPAPVGMKVIAFENGLKFYKSVPEKSVSVFASREDGYYYLNLWFSSKGYILNYEIAVSYIMETIASALTIDENA